MPYRIVKNGKYYEIRHYSAKEGGVYVRDFVINWGSSRKDAEEHVRRYEESDRRNALRIAESDRLAKLGLSPEEEARRYNRFLEETGLVDW